MKSVIVTFQVFLRCATKVSWTLPLALLSATTALSQDHFPLESGNFWNYFVDGDTTWIRYRTIIGDTVMPNGRTYAVMAFGDRAVPNPLGNWFYRQDGDKVYQYSPVLPSGEAVFYDFSKKVGDTVSVLPGEDTIKVASIRMDTVLGTIRKIYCFRRYWSADWVADSLGLIRDVSDPPFEEDIFGAKINGVTYGVITSVRKTSAQTPTGYRLQQNYPNPFNPSTIFTYELPSQSHVSLKIYNLLGQAVQTLVDHVEQAGYQQVEWNASKLPSGIYFYRLDAVSIADPSKSFTSVKKCVLVK